jgi:phosphotransferase system enzyme I (PtsI)
MHASQLFEVKQQVLGSDASLLAGKVARLLRLDDPVRIREQLQKLNAG